VSASVLVSGLTTPADGVQGGTLETAIPNHTDWTKIDWADLYPRLLLIAAGKLNRLSWRGQRFGAIPAGKTATDVVHDAIVKTISGQRVWNQQQNSLFDHLAGVISSEISHLVLSRENRTTLRVDEKIVQLIDHREDPEAIAIRKAQEHNFLIYLEKKKPTLRSLAELVLYDANAGTPDLTVKLGLSLREVESLKKALRRATEEFLDEGDSRQPGSGGANVGNAIDPEPLRSPAVKGATGAS
jgi:hypothetical protein